jgi:acetyl esterase/lipase
MRSILPALLIVLLAACGGGGTTPGGSPGGVSAPPPPPAPARGSVVGGGASVVTVPVAGANFSRLDPLAFKVLLESAQLGTTAITGEPQCTVATYSVKYNTVGGAGEATDASAAIIVPSGAGPSCGGSRPVLLYAHGTNTDKTYDMTRLADNTEARLVAAMYAAQGFIVVAPNYAGYAGSSLSYFPYLDAAQQSADMIDALRAARASFAAIGAADSGKLFVTGYSQGGHVALATLRAMQALGAAEFKPAAVAGLSGPYALIQFGDSVFGGAPRQGVTAFLPLLIAGGQHAGAGIYGAASEIYEAPYAAGIEAGTIKSLPVALFGRDSLPQAAGFGQYFGDDHLIKSGYRAAYLADLAAHPCDLNPAAPLDCAPQHALRQLFRKNDLRSFTPAAPLMLCGGNADPTVPYQNTVSALAYFRANGGAGALAEVDLDTIPGPADPYRARKLDFLAAKAALRAIQNDGGAADAAVEANYHAGLVAPFCLAAARDFFQAVLVR